MKKMCYGCGYSFETEDPEATLCSDCQKLLEVDEDKPNPAIAIPIFIFMMLCMACLLAPFFMFLLSPFLGL
jgi:hypothetical protein